MAVINIHRSNITVTFDANDQGIQGNTGITVFTVMGYLKFGNYTL